MSGGTFLYHVTVHSITKKTKNGLNSALGNVSSGYMWTSKTRSDCGSLDIKDPVAAGLRTSKTRSGCRTSWPLLSNSRINDCCRINQLIAEPQYGFADFDLPCPHTSRRHLTHDTLPHGAAQK